MILAVACLAPETRVLSQTIAGLALEIFSFQNLAGRLMLELIVLAQETITEGTLEYSAAVIPDSSLAFLTKSIHQRTDTSVRRQATSSVTHPGFAMIAYGSHHSQSRGKHTGMTHHAISCFQHTLDFAAMCAHGQTLKTLTEVTEGTTLLLFIALIAFHYGVARKFRQVNLFLGRSDLFLPEFLSLGFFSLTGLLLRHLLSVTNDETRSTRSALLVFFPD